MQEKIIKYLSKKVNNFRSNGKRFTCPDCKDRHNRVKTWDEWEEEGLPRTGATVCMQYCHCVLIPEKFIEIGEIDRSKR